MRNKRGHFIVQLLIITYFYTFHHVMAELNPFISEEQNLDLDYRDENNTKNYADNFILKENEDIYNVHFKEQIESKEIPKIYEVEFIDDNKTFKKEKIELLDNNITFNKEKIVMNDTDLNKTSRIENLEDLTQDTLRTLQRNISNGEISLENCIGQPEYCNMSKEEYLMMLDNYIYPQPYEWVLIGTHSIVFVVGLIGNALVCTAVYRNHSMRTVTNYFIVNLAVADFMVILICLPPTVLWDVTETWFLGTGLCKVMLFFQSVSVTVSVLTLTFISVDRWYAICFPLKFKSTTGRAKTAILIIWIISLIFNSPELIVLTTVKTVPLRFDLSYLVQCMATWSERSDLVWHIIKVLFIYTLPLLLMTVAYWQIVRVLWRSERIPGQAEDTEWTSAEHSQLRSRRKAAKMLVAVVTMFAVCYFPVHLLSVLRYALVMEQNDAITCLALISHVLCYANSAINPLIYNFMSGKFRNEFRRTFCCIPSTMPDQHTTLSRVTSKNHYGNRKSYDMVMYDVKTQVNCKHVCNTSLIEKNGYLGPNGSFRNGR